MGLAACSSGGSGTAPQADVAKDTPVANDLADVPADVPTDKASDVALPEVVDTGAEADLDLAAPDTYFDPGPQSQCVGEQVQDLPGVTIEFTSVADCTWKQSEVAAGIDIPYRVTVTGAYPIVAETQDTGSCGKAGDSGLIVFPTIQDGAGTLTWCECDQGTCTPTATQVTLTTGSWDYAVHWDGKAWNGPGGPGANKPEGAAFPVGSYTLTLSAKAQAKPPGMTQWLALETTATFNLRIVADPPPEIPELAPDIQEVDYFIPAPDVVEETAAETLGDVPPAR
jgi:hypothetical protein